MYAVAAILSPFVAAAAIFFWLDWRRARHLSTPELEALVFSEPQEYFEFIGQDTQPVSVFRELVSTRNLSGIHKQWPTIQKGFRKAEIQAGHSGRPLLMDYFLGYRAYSRELLRRKKKHGTDS